MAAAWPGAESLEMEVDARVVVEVVVMEAREEVAEWWARGMEVTNYHV